MSPEERQEALMGGLTIQGALRQLLDAGLSAWRDEAIEEEGIEVADGEMVVDKTSDGLLLTIGTKTWLIEATEVAP